MLYIKIYVLSNGHGTDLVNSCVPSGRRDRKQNGSYYIDIAIHLSHFYFLFYFIAFE